MAPCPCAVLAGTSNSRTTESGFIKAAGLQMCAASCNASCCATCEMDCMDVWHT
jgi:hypothetical protein